jgi:hypothetical protein
MDLHIAELLRQIPVLNSNEAVVTPLVGGITNQNYRVDIGNESFVLQLGISELDFDYADYAHHHLHRFLQNVATSPFEQWLEDVRR